MPSPTYSNHTLVPTAGQFGSVFAVFCIDKPTLPAKDASTHSHASKLTKTSKAHPQPVWNEDIKPITLKVRPV